MSQTSSHSAQDPPLALHELEREIMERIWQDGPATARSVLQEINRRADRERAYSTVVTVLSRLATKGFLIRERVGRTDVYSAAVDRSQWVRERASVDIDELLDQYGDVALAHFANQVEQLDDERRARLRELLDDA